MAYHANIAPFGRYGEARDSPFNPGLIPAPFSSRSPGIAKDHRISAPWNTSDLSKAYSHRIPSPKKDQQFQKPPEVSPRAERPDCSDAWNFYADNNRLSLSPLSCDQYPHPPPSQVMLRPIGDHLIKSQSNGNWEIPLSTVSDGHSSKALISGETSLFPERLKRRATDSVRSTGRYHSQRRPGNRDEFDGPTQLLDMPSLQTMETQEEDLPLLPTTLEVHEQDQILCDVNGRLSKCAFDFVAKYQFPIPVESDKKHVRGPQDREWTEWVYLLKRLATKRRIPARVLYNGQIKQFVTVLENALETRHVAANQSRILKDDRNILQFISAGTQVAKILKDAPAMEYFDWLYVQTERYIQQRRLHRGKAAFENAR